MWLRYRRLIKSFLAPFLFLGLAFLSPVIAQDELLTGRDEQGRSALHVAVMSGNVELVEYILNVHGADASFVNDTDHYYKAAFDYVLLYKTRHPVLYETLRNYFGVFNHY